METLTKVTPRVGVWIETYYKWCRILELLVTPRVGVWIETILNFYIR